MTHQNRYIPTIISLLMLSISTSVSAQTGISDETKRNLLKSANPVNDLSKSIISVTAPKSSIMDNKYIDAYNNYKSGTKILIDSGHKINSHVFTYKSEIPANQLPPGSCTPVFMGGHFVLVPTGGLLVVPSGISLSGWGGPKKLSEKSKSILKNVFGMEIDE